MITELSLDTGGRFQVFMLVNVKDISLDLFDNHTLHEFSSKVCLKNFEI